MHLIRRSEHRGRRRGAAVAGLVVAVLGQTAVVAGAAPASASTGPTWDQLLPSTPPSARTGAAAAYDVAAGQFVLFGGFNGSAGILGDTWVWNGTTGQWVQQAPAANPPAREGATLAYDPSTMDLVLFGGQGASGYLDDTWTWNGSTWAQQSPTDPPAARTGASMTYDSSTSQLVLFGGFGLSGYLNDTWTWSGTGWVQEAPTTSPPVRDWAVMAEDANGLVLFGGHGSGSAYLGDTWTWDGTDWTAQSPADSPPGRDLASMAFDPSPVSETVLAAGQDLSGYLGDTWTWDGTNWKDQSPVTGLPPRDDATMAFDPGSGMPLLFGGLDASGYLADTWGYATTAGPPGAASSVVAVLGPTGTPGDGQAVVSWRAAAPDGTPITEYDVAVSPACPTACAGTSTMGATSTTVTGLKPGTPYTFTVSAKNGIAPDSESGPSPRFVPTTVPPAPRQVGARLLPSGAVVVSVAPPASTAGLPVTAYEVVPVPPCASCTGTLTHGTQTTVQGLKVGATYRFEVESIDADGAGPVSAPTPNMVDRVAAGYWLAAADGHVFGLGASPSLGGISATSATPVVGIAASPDGGGYLVVTSDGRVAAFGDAHSEGDLPSRHVPVDDIVAIAPTTDGQGYWLIGSDGGEFAFGDARYHGSLPGLKIHVHDVVGMVATPGGGGYLLVGADGGVFAFGATHFYGSLPGRHVRVSDIRAILPSATGRGYVLVGGDGGAFVFGSGVRYYGSLPGRGVEVSDIVGIALTADDGGYLMAGANGSVYGFGNGVVEPSPAALAAHLPVAAIAGI